MMSILFFLTVIFYEDPTGGLRQARRMQHPTRGMGSNRARRSNMHFQPAGSSLSGLTNSNRDTMDPIAGKAAVKIFYNMYSSFINLFSIVRIGFNEMSV